VALVIPELKGKLTGLAVRVPTPNVSLVDFVCEVKKATSAEEVNQAFVMASQKGPLKSILQAVKAPLVSFDYNGSRDSSSVDLPLKMAIDGTRVKVLSWCDNETGFSQRMIELALLMSAKGLLRTACFASFPIGTFAWIGTKTARFRKASANRPPVMRRRSRSLPSETDEKGATKGGGWDSFVTERRATVAMGCFSAVAHYIAWVLATRG
jgi:hypothetical protein